MYNIRPDAFSDVDSNSDLSDYDDEFGYSIGNSRIKRKKKAPPVKDPVVLLEENIKNAASTGDLLSLQNILSSDVKINLDSVLLGGWTVLMCAADSSRENIVKFLLDKGANPNMKCDSFTALMYACKSKTIQYISNYNCVQELLKKKASLNVISKYGCTALMMAIQTGKEDVANVLIPQSNLSIKDAKGWTAAIYAVQYKQANVLRRLVANGASLEESDMYRRSIKEMAREINHAPTIDVFKENMVEIEDEYENNFFRNEIESWHDMFPAIMTTPDKPAYSNNIPMLLNGMRCERLQSCFKDHSMDLETFLCLRNKDMVNLFEVLPFERKRITVGLQKFHTRKWRLETIAGLKNDKRKIDLVSFLTYLGSHLKQLTVIKSSVQYTLDNLDFESGKYPLTEYLDAIDTLSKEIQISRKELRLLKTCIEKINNEKTIPADLITPNDHLIIRSNKIRNRLLCFVAVTAISITVISCHRGKLFGLSFKTPEIQLPTFLLSWIKNY